MKLFTHIFRSVLLVTLVLCCSERSEAQQAPVFDSYLYHSEYYNPAAMGDGQFALIHRRQWIDFGATVAPVTYAINADFSNLLPFSDKVGIGLNLVADNTNVMSRTNIDLSLAYHLYRYEKHRVSLGVIAGILNQSLDFTKLSETELNDLTFYNGSGNMWTFNGGPGLFYTYDDDERRFSASFALPQLFTSDLEFTDEDFQHRFDHRFHVLAGLSYRMNLENIKLEPSVFYRGVNGVDDMLLTKGTVDVNGRAFFMDDAFWASLGYRINGNAILAGFGIDISKQLNLQTYANYHLSLGPSVELVVTYEWEPREPGPGPGSRPVVKDIPEVIERLFMTKQQQLQNESEQLQDNNLVERINAQLGLARQALSQAGYDIPTDARRAKIAEAREHMGQAKSSLDELISMAQTGYNVLWNGNQVKDTLLKNGNYKERRVERLHKPLVDDGKEFNEELKEINDDYREVNTAINTFILQYQLEAPLANIIQRGDLDAVEAKLKDDLIRIPGIARNASVNLVQGGDISKIVYAFPYVEDAYQLGNPYQEEGEPLEDFLNRRTITLNHILEQYEKLKNSRLDFKSVNLQMLLQDAISDMESEYTLYPYTGDLKERVSTIVRFIDTETGERTLRTVEVNEQQRVSITDLACIKMTGIRSYMRKKGISEEVPVTFEISGPNFDEEDTQTMVVELFIER